MFNRNKKSHFSWICCLIRCHSRLKSSLKKVYYPFNVSASKLGLVLPGSDGNSPLHFFPFAFFWIGRDASLFVFYMQSCRCGMLPLATGEFLDVKNKLLQTAATWARSDHNACIPDCERLDGHLWRVLMVKKTMENGEISHLQNDSEPGKLLRSGVFLGSFPWERRDPMCRWVRLDEFG